MRRVDNFLYKLVKDENSTTEFLCNLLSIKIFREKLFESFLPSETINSIVFEHIDTQFSGGIGQPDMVILNQEICALFEIKTERWRKLTDNQPEGYLNYLKQEDNKAKFKVLIFIVPHGYLHEKKLIERFENYSTTNPSVSMLDKGSLVVEDTVKWGIIYWEDIIRTINRNELDRFNPFMNEFTKLLQSWYFPSKIIFKKSEVRMMFSKTIPQAIKTLKKLKSLVDSVEQRSKDYKTSSYHSEKDGEYGIYFKDDKGGNTLWLGIWYDCWEETEYPLVYGVFSDTTEQARKIFLDFIPNHKRKKWEKWDFEFGWFDQVTLSDENAVELIWNEIDPLLEKITKSS